MDQPDDVDESDWALPEEFAMQARCVHCLREQYALAVLAVSLGKGVCSWCLKASRPMTHEEYRTALHERLDHDDTEACA